MPATVITPERACYIREQYLNMSIKKMAQHLSISRSAIEHFMKKDQLQVPNSLRNHWRGEALKKPYTAEEHQFIDAHIRTHSIDWIAAQLKRANYHVLREIHRMGYAELLNEKKLKNRFKKGCAAKNKGQKMSAELYEKVKHTFFKKGHLPHNTLPEDTEVIRNTKGIPYLYIKIAGERKVVPKHRYLWQQAYGAIPKGYKIVFKNGNTLDCRLDNLACMSDEEVMQNNSIHRYPEDLKKAIKQISKIKKQLQK